MREAAARMIFAQRTIYWRFQGWRCRCERRRLLSVHGDLTEIEGRGQQLCEIL